MAFAALSSVNIGTVANDGTGDTLRTAGGKINDNTFELWTYAPVRHRQSLLEWARDGAGNPAFLSATGLDIDLIAPLAGSCMVSADPRGERNLMMVVNSDVTAAWTISASVTTYLYIERDTVTGDLSYGAFLGAYTDSYVAPTSPTAGDRWLDRANYRLAIWSGTTWDQYFQLVIAQVTSDATDITGINYLTGNEELSLAQSLANKAAIILG